MLILYKYKGQSIGDYSSQYYDWDNNFCHRLDWMNDNSITEIESDTEIPAEIDPSQMTNFPDFEPQKLKELVS